MKSFLKFLPIAAAVLLATSCSKDDNDNAPTNGRDGVHTVSTSTIPFTIRVNTGRSLKKVGYAKDPDNEGYYNISFTDDDVDNLKMIIKENGTQIGEATLQSDKSTFSGGLTKQPSSNASLTAEISVSGSQNSSDVSLAALLATCAHRFLGTFNYGAAEVTLTDQNAYLAITYFESDKIDLNGSTIDLTDHKVWVAVPANAEVTSQALGISKPAKEVAPGTIYTVDRYFTPKAFTVSETKQVYFSSGNLQYNPAQDKWQFAAHQYDICIKEENYDVSSMYNKDYDGWIDLFGWGTWLNGDGIEKPYETQEDYPTKYIWSGKSAIGEKWEILPIENFLYLFWDDTRADKYGEGNVAGVNGIILFPDDWTYPTDLTSSSTSAANFTTGMFTDWYNTYTAEDWAKMEANGAVFLPAALGRYGTGVYSIDGNGVGGDGNYWSSSADNEYVATYLYFDMFDVHPFSEHGRSRGLSVRLVRAL